jgi:hypothetical protein
MSARHIQRALRQQDRDHDRLLQLMSMTGTGQGIQRIRSRTANAPAPPSIRAGGIIPKLVATIDTGFGGALLIHGTGTSALDYPDDPQSPTEVSMSHYRALCREKEELTRKLFGWAPGLDWWQIAKAKPHTSPFGPDRFRVFSQAPYFEEPGFIQRIGR